MLMPKRVKYRKQIRGRMTGKATRGAEMAFGEYGLQALEPGWVSAARSKPPAGHSFVSCAAVVRCGSVFSRINPILRNRQKRVWVKVKVMWSTGYLS